MPPSVFIKLCGFRDAQTIASAQSLHVEALGLNLVPTSKRFVSVAMARALAAQVGCEIWWVIDAAPPAELQSLFERYQGRVQRTDARWPWPDWVPTAARVDVLRWTNGAWTGASSDHTTWLVDAAQGLGGSGHTADWEQAALLAKQHPIWLAGGLHANNVAEAIRSVDPIGVDVASGIEAADGTKSELRMREFVNAVRLQERV